MHYGRVLVDAIETRLEKVAPGLSAAQLRGTPEKQQQQQQQRERPADDGAGPSAEATMPQVEALRAAVGLGRDNENVRI